MPDAPKEPADYILADNLGNQVSEELFEAAESCPLCGGELMYGSGATRLENTDEMSMVTDIDSGNKLQATVRAKSCPGDGYAMAKIEVSSYSGY